MDFEPNEVRAQRRRRSTDEEEEEAKRHRLDSPGAQLSARLSQGRGSESPRLSSTIPGSSQEGRAPAPTGVSTLNRTTPPTQAAPVENAAAPNAAAKNKRPRFPPLVVEKLPNWAHHFRALARSLGRPPNARPYGSGVRFSPETEDEYRLVQRYLVKLEKEESISWFAYSLPAERLLKVAIRGLPADTDPQEIEEELRNLGYEPEYVRHIRARQGRPGCVFYATLKRTADFRRIYDTSVFLLMRGVKIEAWRGKRGPAQCHRCQKFRHSSHQCHRPLACVRCGEGHAARDCPRPKEEAPTCVNCGGAHPASHVSCPVFKKEMRTRRAGTAAITATSTRRPATTTTTATEATPQEEGGASLMAAANGPTTRGAPLQRRRRKRKRGGKGKKPKPPATEEEKEAPKAAPAPVKVQANAEQRVATVGAGTAQQQPRKQNNQRKQQQKPKSSAPATASADAPAGADKKEFTACAIKLLMELMKAISTGQDVERVILDGLATLLTLYHG